MKSSVFLFSLFCLAAHAANIPLDLFHVTKVLQPLLLPENNVPCYQTDANYSQCINDKLAVIISQMNSFMNRDPMTAANFEQDYKHGPMHGTVNLRDFNFYGLNQTEYVYGEMFYLDKKVHAKIDLHIPTLRLEAYYKNDFTYVFNETDHIPDVLASLNGTEVHQEGIVGVTINEVNVTHYWLGHVTTEGYLELKEVELDIEVDEMKWIFSGLYPERERNDKAVEVLNKNWRLFYNLYLPRLKYSVEAKIVTMVNRFMATTPFKSIIEIKGEDNHI